MLVMNYLPRQGGAEYIVHHLTTALIQHGHQVTVLAEYDPAAKGFPFPYSVYQPPPVPLMDPVARRFLHALYHTRRQKFDVVHMHIAWPGAATLGKRLQRWCHVPIVLTPYGGDVQVAPEIRYGLCLDPVAARKVGQTLRMADLVTAPSRRVRQAIVDRGGNPDRIRDVPFGTEYDKIQQIKTADLRSELGLSPDDFVVLSVGRNSPVKDIPTLIEGLRLAAATEPRLKCILVGPDKTVRGLVDQAQLSDRVKVLGRIPTGYDPLHPTNLVFQTPYPEMVAAYRACNLYVSTSYIEAFNTSVHDAFACGRPALITNTHGNMDVLKEGVNGCSVPPHDPEAVAEKLLHLARNRDVCARMGEHALATARLYDWTGVAKQYVAVYEEAVALCAGSTTKA